MQVLFKAFFYTEAYWKLIETGQKAEGDEVDYEKDCEKRPMLINVVQAHSAKPYENGKYTSVCDGTTSYVLDIPFVEYLQIVPYQFENEFKKKWAN